MFAKILAFFDGKKNYLFAASMIVIAALNQFVPEFAKDPIVFLGMTDPSTLLTAGLGWAFGRDAIAKIGK